MKKLLFLLAVSIVGITGLSCTTVSIIAPPGTQVTLASRNAKCQWVKRRKVIYLYGIPMNWTVFNELLAGVRQPVKIRVLNTWWDNFMSNMSSSRDRRGRSNNEIEIKTMDVYSCVEPGLAAMDAGPAPGPAPAPAPGPAPAPAPAPAPEPAAGTATEPAG
ncbi:hypothetical protein KKF34_07170 [Myxococcota bacterium]|nr:hypothetical protein [Myxococcota bacterium]MBU1382246.1 hypothetical protein [Myxococcota bacterium]MBU1496643.1 hypothetical protein [Myxococcota bacterium]